MKKDRSTGLISLILGAAMAVATFQLPGSTIVGDVGPKVFPSISSALLLICGAGLLISGKDDGDSKFTGVVLKRLGIIFGTVLIYCVVMNYLGFIAPSIAAFFVLSTLFAKGQNVAWWKRLIYSVVLTMVIYLLFHNVLNLKLPTFRFF